ncbi:MAG TPA: hypothetical protein VI039_06910 [Solirubrobacterales bacterium]
MTLIPAGWRFGVGLLAFWLIAFGLWSLFRDSAPEQAARHLRPAYETQSSQKWDRSQSELPVIPHLEDRQRASFAVFRTSPEPLPRSMRLAMRRPAYGINWDLAQRLPIKHPARAWAAPGDGYICIFTLQVRRGSGAVGATCDTTGGALDRGLAATLLTERGIGAFQKISRAIVGIAPDRAHEIVAEASGAAVRIAVVDGVFVRHDAVPSPPDRLRLVETAGPTN